MTKTLVAIVFLPLLALAVGGGETSGEAQTTPTLLLDDFAALEGNSGAEQIVDYAAIRLSSPATFTVSFQYGLNEGTALYNIDWAGPTTGQVFIPPGVISATIPVSVFGGTFDSEVDESIQLTILNVVGAGGPSPDNLAVLTITNDDNLVSIVTPVATADEGPLGSTTVMTMTATVTPAASFPIRLDLVSDDGTAKNADGDYRPAASSITIPPLAALYPITYTALGDNLVEDLEFFFAGPAAVRNAILSPTTIVSTTLVIVDDDNPCGTTLDGFGGYHSTAGASCSGPTAPDGAGGAIAMPSMTTPYFGFDIARDFEYAGGGYYVLDGFGGVHADGGAPPLSPAPPYFGFDVAEDIEFLCDGSGAYVLDGFGGVHAAGGASPPSPTTPYFGFNIARDMEPTCPGLGIHVLDGFGGLHSGAGAPIINPAPPYFGFDIAKDVELPCGGQGAYVLDGFGGVHAAGGSPVLSPTTPYFGFNAAADMELTCPANGYVVLDSFGGFHFGGAATPVAPTPPYFGFNVARDFEGIQ